MFDRYVRYSDDVEKIGDDEVETAEKIIKVMSKGGEIVEKREDHALRTSHAKAHALATGELRVSDGLPDELRQGLFANAKTYPVIIRMAHVPGEFLDDRRVSTPRGFAMKVLEVEGPTLHGDQTQDWVLDTGETFIARNGTTFLAEITQTEMATPMPEGVKQAVSATSRVTNAALNAIGLNSDVLDFYGHPKLNPLTETYFSQTPLRFGDYIAKLRVRPVSFDPDQEIDIQSENGLRETVAPELRARGAEYAVEVQLCTDLDKMPVENATAHWSQEESPYREVARLVIKPQDADPTGPHRGDEERLSFSPAHSLEAHRPLGSVNRARMRVYKVMADKRRQANNVPTGEPTNAEPVPA